MNSFSILLMVASSIYLGKWLQIMLGVDGLNHGRPAKLGEFPFVMRIHITEEGATQNNTDDVDAGNVATGVLVKPTKVLTTCDSVGFFTGQTVNLYRLNRVTIMGGSIRKSGDGGVTQVPTNSSVHPFCYSLMVSKIILFNYGMYDVATDFNSPQVSPIKNPFKHKWQMTAVMKALWEQRSHLTCQSAGWGNPRKQFEGNGMPDHFERFAPILQAADDVHVTTFNHCRTEICDFFGECLLSLWEYGFICGKAERGGPCNEDEGAPLICGGTVMAIYSNPQRCEDVGLPRPFLRLDLAYEYVFDIMGASTARVALTLMSTALWLSVEPHFRTKIQVW